MCVCVSAPIIDTKSIFIMNNVIPAFRHRDESRVLAEAQTDGCKQREQRAVTKKLKDSSEDSL